MDIEWNVKKVGRAINTVMQAAMIIPPDLLAKVSHDMQMEQEQRTLSAMYKALGLGDVTTETLLNSLRVLDEESDISPDIKSLKKRLKYAKSPLEKQMLNRQLNKAYKERSNLAKR